MYQPWGDDPTDDDIIKLIEEKEREEVNYSSYENDSGDWNIVSIKELGGVTPVQQSNKPKHEVHPDTPGEHWRYGRGQEALKSRESSSDSGSIQPAVMPIKTWSSKIADTLNSELRTEIEVELIVKKRSLPRDKKLQRRSRSRSPSLPRHKTLQRRSRSGSPSLPRDKTLQRRSRSRSPSLPRDKTLQRRSRSRSPSLPRDKTLQRRSRNRSSSLPRDKKLKRRSGSRSPSLPRNKKLQRRSGSRSRFLPRNKKLQRRSGSRSRFLPRNKKLQRHSGSRSRFLPRNKKLQRRSRSRSPSLPRKKKLQRRSRSRSPSLPRKKKLQRRSPSRSRSLPRNKKLQRGSRSRSRSLPKVKEPERNRSRDRKADSSVRNRSHSGSTERKRDSGSPRRRLPTPKAEEKPVENSDEILSKFVNLMQDVKNKQPAPPAQTIPNPNVLPEFDSSNNGHFIVSWLLRVDDIARLFEWDDKQTIQYALPKLMGAAKTWYQTLQTVPYSWAEWRKKLKKQFPSPDFSQLLMEMCGRQSKAEDTVEQYYNDKILLVNRCGFKGRQAVECILAGVTANAVRLCGEAADFSEPEEVFKYLKGVEDVWLKYYKLPKTTKAVKNKLATLKTLNRQRITTSKCSCCGKQGHKDCSIKIPNSSTATANANPPFINEGFQKAPDTPQPCEIQQFQPRQFQPQPLFELPLFQPPQFHLPQFQPPRFLPPRFLPPRFPPRFQPPRFRLPQFQRRQPQPRIKQPQKIQSKPPSQPSQTKQPNIPAKEKKNKLCFNCRVAGHVAEDCPEKNKKPMTSTNNTVTVAKTSVETPVTPSAVDSLVEPDPPNLE